MRAGLAALAVALAACAPVGNVPVAQSDTTVTLVKSLGLRQCEGGIVSPEALVADLRRAGIEPHSADCGSDGMMHVTVCGAGTGDLGVFRIAVRDVAKAQSLGFRPMTPDAHIVACPVRSAA